MRAIRVLSILLCCAAFSYAGEVSVNWDPVTTYVDDTTITDEVISYRVEVGTVSGGYDQQFDVPFASGTAYTVKGLLRNTEYFIVVIVVGEDGRESVPSNEISVTLSFPNLSAPTSFRLLGSQP